MKRIQDTKQLLAIAAFAFLVAAFLLSLLLFRVQEANTLIEKYKQEISKQVAKAEELRDTKLLLKDTEEDRSKLSSYFVPKGNTVSFIKRVESLGEEAGISVKVESVEVHSEEKDKYAVLDMSVSGKGDWSSLFQFFSALEVMPYNIEISNVAMRTNLEKEKKEWSGDFEFFVSKIK